MENIVQCVGLADVHLEELQQYPPYTEPAISLKFSESQSNGVYIEEKKKLFIKPTKSFLIEVTGVHEPITVFFYLDNHFSDKLIAENSTKCEECEQHPQVLYCVKSVKSCTSPNVSEVVQWNGLRAQFSIDNLENNIFHESNSTTASFAVKYFCLNTKVREFLKTKYFSFQIDVYSRDENKLLATENYKIKVCQNPKRDIRDMKKRAMKEMKKSCLQFVRLDSDSLHPNNMSSSSDYESMSGSSSTEFTESLDELQSYIYQPTSLVPLNDIELKPSTNREIVPSLKRGNEFSDNHFHVKEQKVTQRDSKSYVDTGDFCNFLKVTLNGMPDDKKHNIMKEIMLLLF